MAAANISDDFCHSDGGMDYRQSIYDPNDYQRFSILSLSKQFNEPHYLLPLIRVISVILLRVGYVLVQIGSIPVTNVHLILSQNIIELCWVSIVFLLIGTIFAYTGDLGGVMGQFYWVCKEEVNKNNVVVGWQAAMIASAISSTCLAGRMHIVAQITIGFVLSGILQPLVIHWIWHEDGWASYNYFRSAKVKFHDYGGSVPVHLIGGLTGFVGCLILGRRILMLDDVDKSSVSANSVTTTILGYFLVVVGFQSLVISNDGNEIYQLIVGRLHMVIIKFLLAISSCTIVVVFIHFYIHKSFDYWLLFRCAQAAIAGIVIVSAGIDVYQIIPIVLISCIGGVLFYLGSRLMFKTPLEDYCNIVPTHIVCALIGSLIAPFFHKLPPHIPRNFSQHLSDVAWYYICLILIITIIISVMTTIFWALDSFGYLRNAEELTNHARSRLIIQRNPPSSIFKKLFKVNPNTTFIQPRELNQDAGGTLETSL